MQSSHVIAWINKKCFRKRRYLLQNNSNDGSSRSAAAAAVMVVTAPENSSMSNYYFDDESILSSMAETSAVATVLPRPRSRSEAVDTVSIEEKEERASKLPTAKTRNDSSPSLPPRRPPIAADTLLRHYETNIAALTEELHEIDLKCRYMLDFIFKYVEASSTNVAVTADDDDDDDNYDATTAINVDIMEAFRRLELMSTDSAFSSPSSSASLSSSSSSSCSTALSSATTSKTLEILSRCNDKIFGPLTKSQVLPIICNVNVELERAYKSAIAIKRAIVRTRAMCLMTLDDTKGAMRLLEILWCYVTERCSICLEYVNPFRRITWIRYVPCAHMCCAWCFVELLKRAELLMPFTPENDNVHPHQLELSCHLCRGRVSTFEYVNDCYVVSRPMNDIYQLADFYKHL